MRWKMLKKEAHLELEQSIIWNPTLDLYRYDLEKRGPDGRPWIPTVERTSSVSADFPFVFRGFSENGHEAPVVKLDRDMFDNDDIDECSARVRLLRRVTKKKNTEDDDECVSTSEDLVTELRDKICVKCDYWTTLAVGIQICTTSYRAVIKARVIVPLTGHLLIPPLVTVVLDYVPFFLQCVMSNSFCDEDEMEENPHLAVYCHDCSGENPELVWYLTHCGCKSRRSPKDLSSVATDQQRKTAVALWTVIHRACVDVPDLDELTHVN
jgi:hypothetical protein